MNDPYANDEIHVVQIKVGKNDWFFLHRMIPGRGNVPTLTAALFKKFITLLQNGNISLTDYAAGNDGILEGLVENLRLGNLGDGLDRTHGVPAPSDERKPTPKGHRNHEGGTRQPRRTLSKNPAAVG